MNCADHVKHRASCQNKLIWVPRGDNFQCQNAKNHSIFQDGRIVKNVAKEIAFNLIRNLVLSEFGASMSTAATGALRLFISDDTK